MIRWKSPSFLIGIVLALLVLGIVILASASSVRGETYHFDPQYFLKRQLVWLAIALAAGSISTLINYHWWRRAVIPAMIVAAILLVLVFIPPLGRKIGGSWRWLRLGGFSFQPSELAKLVTVLMLASWITFVGPKIRRFLHGVLFPLILLGIFVGLIFLEPDFGTTALVAMVGGILLFVAGSRFSHLALIGGVALAFFAIAIYMSPVRSARVRDWVVFMMGGGGGDPGSMPPVTPAAYHMGQSKESFMLGGLSGHGLGESLQKQFYLPEAHTDFILAIIAEELGLAFSCGVVLMFLGFVYCGLGIARKAPDEFGWYLGLGITLSIGLQAAINIAVVTGCVPPKGLPLPFISYGGTSLIMSLIGVGVLLNIARQAPEPEIPPDADLEMHDRRRYM